MRENRLFTTGLAIIAVLLLFLSLGRLLGENKAPRYKISVVVDRSSSAGWEKFRKGLNAAAKHYNMEYNYETTNHFISIQQEYLSISGELKSGADGIITELRATEGTGAMLNELGKNGKIELVNSEKEFTEASGAVSSVGVDEEALGKALSDEVLRSDLQKYKLRIGILSGNQNKGNMKRRLLSLKKKLLENGQEIAWEISDRGQVQKDLEEANHKRSVDLIIALENDSLEIAARYLRDTGRSFVELYGVGDSDEAVYDLDRGLIRTLIVIDQYEVAYSAMESLWLSLSNTRRVPEDRMVKFYVVKASNMYSDEMEQILFPTG